MSNDLADPGSVTTYIDELKGGDTFAAQKLWDCYVSRLIGLARSKLRRPGGIEDEEDAALSAFHSVCAGTARGQFPLLSDRDDLRRACELSELGVGLVGEARRVVRVYTHDRRYLTRQALPECDRVACRREITADADDHERPDAGGPCALHRSVRICEISRVEVTVCVDQH